MIKEFYKDFLENIAWWSLGWFALLAGVLNLTQGIWGWLSAICLLLASMFTLPICRSWLIARFAALQKPRLVRRMTIGVTGLLLLGILLTPMTVNKQTTFASEDNNTITELPTTKQSTETIPLIIKLISSLLGS